MTDTEDRKPNGNEAELEHLFSLSRGSETAPSGELMSRILRDAQSVHEDRVAGSSSRSHRRSPVAAILDVIGGWPALAGMASAACIGLWIGVNPPKEMAEIGDSLLISETDAYLAEFLSGAMLYMGETEQ